MTRLRAITTATGVLGALLLLTACTGTGPDVVNGTGTAVPDMPTSTAGSSPVGPASPTAVRPVLLSATDLGPGWTAATAGAPTGDWVTGCSPSTGIAALQRPGARQASFTGPHGLRLTTRVASYTGGHAAAALDALSAFYDDCGTATVGTRDTSWVSLDTSYPTSERGGEATTTTAAGDTVATSAYWMARVGNDSVEVMVSGLLDQSGIVDPMIAFSHTALAAAKARATGHQPSTLPAPPFPAAPATVPAPGTRTGGSPATTAPSSDGTPGRTATPATGTAPATGTDPGDPGDDGIPPVPTLPSGVSGQAGP